MQDTIWQVAPFVLVGLVLVWFFGCGLLLLISFIDRLLDYPWWLDYWPFVLTHLIADWWPVCVVLTVLLDTLTLPFQLLGFPIYWIVYNRIRSKRRKRARIIAALKGNAIALDDGSVVTFVDKDDSSAPNLAGR